jgi:hypothetical protein
MMMILVREDIVLEELGWVGVEPEFVESVALKIQMGKL